MRTAAGGVLSILMIFITVVFALRKLQDLIDRKNPSVNYWTDFNVQGDVFFELDSPEF